VAFNLADQMGYLPRSQISAALRPTPRQDRCWRPPNQNSS
jgi:hypothetical protein